MAEDMGDKTELPSQRRLTDAHEEGRVAKSQDLAGAADLIGAFVLLVLLGSSMVGAGGAFMRRALEDDNSTQINAAQMGILGRDALFHALTAGLPFLGGAFLVAAASHILQSGIVWSGKPISPDLGKLNPIKGIQRLFGLRGAMKTGMSMLKLGLICAVAWPILLKDASRVANLPMLDLLQGVREVFRMMSELALWILAVLLTLGVADYAVSRWQHIRDLRMTKQEVKDEHKSMEGDPHLKGRRAKLMREIGKMRARQAVPKADVVVTNPTHFSVAIQYDQTNMRAPRVVAKGVDVLAMQIRQIAGEHKVPILERPPLARALYYGVEVGGEVPPDQYQAVAEVLAYVYRLRGKAAPPALSPPVREDLFARAAG